MEDKEKNNLIGQYIQQLDKLLSYESAFFTNLLLLGFDIAAEQKKHGIPFTAQMFKTPNSKAMEVIFHFLFMQLDPVKTKEDFRALWPIHDKQQQREFKIKVVNLLSQLETSEGLGRGIPPNLAKGSLIQTCSGERFYQLLFHFSTYVLCVAMRKEFPQAAIPQFPSLTPIQTFNYNNVMRNALQSQITIKAHRFLRNTDTAVQAENAAYAYLEDLQREKNLIQFHMDALKQQFAEFGIDVETLNEEELESEIEKVVMEQQESLNQQLESLRTVWETLLHFHSDTETVQKRETIKNIIHKKKSPYELHDTDLAFNIPNLLSIFHSTDNNTQVKYQQLQHQLDKVTLYKNDKLDLSALVTVWTLSMEALSIFLNDKFASSTQFAFSSLFDVIPALTQHANNHVDYLSSLKSLHAQVIAHIHKVEQNATEINTTNNTSNRDVGFIKKMVPPTPIKRFDDSPELSPITSPSLSRFSPAVDNVMLKKIMDSVRRVATSKRVNSASVPITPFSKRLQDDNTPSLTPYTSKRPTRNQNPPQTSLYARTRSQTTLKNNLQTPLPKPQPVISRQTPPPQPSYQKPIEEIEEELNLAAEEFAEQMMQFTEGRANSSWLDFDKMPFNRSLQSPRTTSPVTKTVKPNPKKSPPIDPKEASMLTEVENALSENREFLEMMQNTSNLSFDQIALSPGKVAIPDEVTLNTSTDFDWMKDDLIDAETRMLLNS